MSDAITFLPPNATALERAAARRISRIDALPTPLRELWDPYACPTPVLPWLAFGFGVEEWNPAWTEEQRRNVIAQSIPIKQHKGTIGAVRNAVNVLGFGVRVQEWFSQIPRAAPYTYKLFLEIDQVGYTLAELRQLIAIVDRAKNLRSHLDVVMPIVTSRGPLVVGAVASTGVDMLVMDGTPKYADGGSAVDLLIDAAVNGGASTIAALDELDNILRVDMPANEWADA